MNNLAGIHLAKVRKRMAGKLESGCQAEYPYIRRMRASSLRRRITHKTNIVCLYRFRSGREARKVEYRTIYLRTPPGQAAKICLWRTVGLTGVLLGTYLAVRNEDLKRAQAAYRTHEAGFDDHTDRADARLLGRA